MLPVLFLTGSFASTLPTYQRSEVILFIMSKVPLPSLHHPVETGRTGLVLCFLPAYPLWLWLSNLTFVALLSFLVAQKTPLSRGIIGPMPIFQASSPTTPPHVREVMGSPTSLLVRKLMRKAGVGGVLLPSC